MKKKTLILQMINQKCLILFKEPAVSNCLCLGSTSSITDNWQSSDMEVHNSNQKQLLKEDDSQAQSSSSSPTIEDFLKQLGLSRALYDSTMESLADKINHQSVIYHVQVSIEELVQSSPKENCLTILQLCFEEGRARELHTYIVKNSLLKHECLEYWICLYIEYVNDQVNNKQKMENTGATEGEWGTIKARTSRNDTREIDCINLRSANVNSFVENDNKLRLLIGSEKYWYHGTSKPNAERIRENGIILSRGRQGQDFSNGYGFYLNANFSGAKEWALQKSKFVPNMEGAVLIYSFSRDDFNGVELFNDREKWRSVVKYYRSKMEYRIPEDLENELTFSSSGTHYIIGNIAEFKHRNEDFESWTPIPYNRSSQICIREDAMARYANRTLEAIVYLTA